MFGSADTTIVAAVLDALPELCEKKKRTTLGIVAERSRNEGKKKKKILLIKAL